MDAACSWTSQRLFSPTGLRAGAAAAPLPFSGLSRKENERGRWERRARGRKAEDKAAWVDLSLFLALQGHFPTKSSSKSRRLALFLLHPMFKFFSLGISFLPMSVHLQFVWVQNITLVLLHFCFSNMFFYFVSFFSILTISPSCGNPLDLQGCLNIPLPQNLAPISHPRGLTLLQRVPGYVGRCS